MPKPPSPQWSRTQPSAAQIAGFLARVADQPFSYGEVGATKGGPPAGYNFDDNAVQLGRGAEAFARGCAALRTWRMFPAPWTQIRPVDAPIREGQVVAMLARAFGLWWLSSCRIVYVVDETAPVRRFGFAYGTLPAHVEQGEELFSIEWRPDDTVWYRVLAFSHPRYWPVRLAKPLARNLQRKFVRDSKAAMVLAVGTPA
ncbi:MAG: DUF1990 domain-containing protein [Opitutaceae bacterium]|nr:DUF1990 domain-containing protein [Opitutaceae bacterium]